ncbi:ABC transporter permease subunit [Akkermansiaceae bacterium]|nr:ABC transporter permease subunit [Akkermansiaceae bacterium]
MAREWAHSEDKRTWYFKLHQDATYSDGKAVKAKDYAAMVVAMAGICIVAFVLGPIFQLSIARPLSVLNVAGWSRPADIILPSVTLCFGVAAYLARLTRGGMLDVLSQDYIRTARAKGVPTLQIITKHALRPALMPAVTFLGPAFAGIITGITLVIAKTRKVTPSTVNGTSSNRRRK